MSSRASRSPSRSVSASQLSLRVDTSQTYSNTPKDDNCDDWQVFSPHSNVSVSNSINNNHSEEISPSDAKIIMANYHSSTDTTPNRLFQNESMLRPITIIRPPIINYSLQKTMPMPMPINQSQTIRSSSTKHTYPRPLTPRPSDDCYGWESDSDGFVISDEYFDFLTESIPATPAVTQTDIDIDDTNTYLNYNVSYSVDSEASDIVDTIVLLRNQTDAQSLSRRHHCATDNVSQRIHSSESKSIDWLYYTYMPNFSRDGPLPKTLPN